MSLLFQPTLCRLAPALSLFRDKQELISQRFLKRGVASALIQNNKTLKRVFYRLFV